MAKIHVNIQDRVLLVATAQVSVVVELRGERRGCCVTLHLVRARFFLSCLISFLPPSTFLCKFASKILVRYHIMKIKMEGKQKKIEL